MRKSTTMYRNTVESPNTIQRTVDSLFDQLESGLEHKTGCSTKERNTHQSKKKTQTHTIQKLIESICTEAGMKSTAVEDQIGDALSSGADGLVLEINYGSFGRVGVSVSEGRTDIFSSMYDNYRFTLPKRDTDDNIEDLRDEISSKSVTHDDGVGFALFISNSTKDLRVHAHVFDRPNELLLQRNTNSKSLLRRLLGL